jgi:hypothetical protein
LTCPGAQQMPLTFVCPGAQQASPMHVVPAAQQSSVWLDPQPTLWPHPMLPKSAQVRGMHGSHVLLLHAPPSQNMHCSNTPQPRSIGLQPVTLPAAVAAAHVDGAQHLPPLQISLPGHGDPQLTLWPQAFWARPQVAVPHEGAGQVTHAPFVHCMPLGQPAQRMLPLPQAFGTVPHRAPPVAVMHSGGGGPQTPAEHCCPFGHEHRMVLPQASATVPHRVVMGSGVQVRGPQDPLASTVTCGPQVLLMHAWPVLHPPQSIGTPQPSIPTTPHLPWQLGAAWQDCDEPFVVQICPPVQAEPHTKALPEHGST